MKKLVLLFVAMLMSTTFFAQEHLDFRGVPIDGHIDNFVSKMEGLGYTLDNKSDKSAKMSGQFTGRNVELWIFYTRKTHTVWKVVMYFDEDSWSSLKSDYFEYKKLYTQKYGEPSSSYEFFSKPYYEGDGYELQALRKEKCHYLSLYKLDTGTIAVQISEFEQLKLAYEDEINSDLMTEEKNSAALDEI